MLTLLLLLIIFGSITIGALLVLASREDQAIAQAQCEPDGEDDG